MFYSSLALLFASLSFAVGTGSQVDLPVPMVQVESLTLTPSTIAVNEHITLLDVVFDEYPDIDGNLTTAPLFTLVATRRPIGGSNVSYAFEVEGSNFLNLNCLYYLNVDFTSTDNSISDYSLYFDMDNIGHYDFGFVNSALKFQSVKFTLYLVYYGADDLNNGYDSGYDSGYNNGYGDGYNNGYGAGKTDGYTEGYNTALNGHNFSFTNLFASISDTPILLIRRLFGFEIFGTSVMAIFMSLFTALIVIKVIKRVF